MAALTLAEIATLAQLARLELTAAEADALRIDLAAILAHVGALAAVDVDGVEPMTHGGTLAPARADVVAASLPVADALGAAPAVADDQFVVPAAIPGAGT